MNHAIMSGIRQSGAFALCGLAILLGGRAFGADSPLSEAAFVYLKPETSSFWHTAPGRTFEVPVSFPAGATTATLSVRGSRYARDYEGITASSFTLSLPEASERSQEDVYSLTLSFDDGTVQTARLGLVQGLMDGPCGATPCVAASDWNWAQGNGVLPVPPGMTGLTVDGVSVSDGDKGFTGAAGWHALGRLRSGRAVDLVLTVGEQSYAATGVRRANAGLALVVR